MTLKEFVKEYKFQKKLVIYNSDELYNRECALCAEDDVPVINCEGEYLLSVARNIVVKYYAVLGKWFEEIDENNQAGMIMALALKLIHENKLSYFKESMIDSGTAQQVTTDINILRREKKLDRLQNHTDSKLSDIYIIASDYIKTIESDEVLDSVSILKKAIEALDRDISYLNADLVTIYDDAYNEFSCLEKEFYAKLINNKSNLGNIISSSSIPKKQPQKSLFKVFGLNNEIHAVVKDVLKKGIPWERVQLVVCNTDRLYPMITYLKELNIPYYLPEGVTEQYEYISAYIRRYLENRANFDFDKNKVNIRISFQSLAEKLKERANNGKIPENQVITFLNKAEICDKNARLYEFNADYNVAIKFMNDVLLGEMTHEKSKTESGSLYIASLMKTETIFRPHVYFLGFEARNYPGSHMQSSVLLDKDMKELGLDERYMSTGKSQKEVERVKRLLESDAEYITISYVSYDSVHMREQNPSSVYQEELQSNHIQENKFGFTAANKDDVMELREWVLL